MIILDVGFKVIHESVDTLREQGDHGFGFDPLFLLKRYNKTFGELPASIKAKISHRARALKKFKALLGT